MILINLLPHREIARKRKRETFQLIMVAAAVVGAAIVAAVYGWYQVMLDRQQSRNTYLSQQIKVLDGQIKDVVDIEDEIAALRARQKAVEDLQADRNLPVYMLNELVKQVPDGVYLTRLKQDGEVVTIGGMAQSNERVSELLRNLSDNTPWFAKPQLVEIVAANVALSAKDQRPVSSFNLSFRLVRSSDAKKAIDAAQGDAASGKK